MAKYIGHTRQFHCHDCGKNYNENDMVYAEENIEVTALGDCTRSYTPVRLCIWCPHCTSDNVKEFR